MDNNLMRYILPVGASGAGAYFANKAQSDAAGEAAQYQQNAMNNLTNVANNMYDRNRADLQPYQNVFQNASGQLNNAITNPSPYASQYVNRLQKNNNMYSPNALNLTRSVADNVRDPNLQNSVNFNLAQDPLYQAQQREIMRQINARNAAMGKMNSSDADSAVARNTAALMEGAYGRQLGDLERSNQNALSMYGVDVDRFNRGLTNANLNNQTEMSEYGWETDRYNRNQQNILNQYGITDAADKSNYNRLLDAANIGMRATENVGRAGDNLVNTLGNAYSSAADAQAQSALAQGQSQAQLAGALGNLPFNYEALKTMGSLVDGGSAGNLLGGAGAAAGAAGGLGVPVSGSALTAASTGSVGPGLAAGGLAAPVPGSALTAASTGSVGAAGGLGAPVSGSALTAASTGSVGPGIGAAGGLGAPVPGSAITAASGGGVGPGVGAVGGVGAATGGIGAAGGIGGAAGLGSATGAGGGVLGSAGTAAGMSGLGLAAGLAPFAAMGGFIGYKASQQGQQTGINARSALQAAERGDKVWRNEKQGYSIDLTNPAVVEELKKLYVHQASYNSAPGKDRMYGQSDGSMSTGGFNIDVRGKSLDDLKGEIQSYLQAPVSQANLYAKTSYAH